MAGGGGQSAAMYQVPTWFTSGAIRGAVRELPRYWRFPCQHSRGLYEPCQLGGPERGVWSFLVPVSFYLLQPLRCLGTRS